MRGFSLLAEIVLPIMSASHSLATDAVFVGTALIASCTFAFSYGMRLLERALVLWKGKS